MEANQTNKKPQLAKKYNLQAMNAYNFDNINFDIDIGHVDQKEHNRMIQEAEKYQQQEKRKKQQQQKK